MISRIIPFVMAMAALATVPLSTSLSAQQDNPPGLDLFLNPLSPQEQTRLAERSKVIADLAFAQGFKGEIAIDMGGLTLISHVSPDLAREGYVPFQGEAPLWPYGSITKQMLVARMLGELKRDRISLDTPISRFVTGFRRAVRIPTIRQLMQHRSGLRNPDDTPANASGFPEFYHQPGDYGLNWCRRGRSAPSATDRRANDCDYIVLGAAFDELSFESYEYMLVGVHRVINPEEGDEKSMLQELFVKPDNTGQFFAMRAPESEVLPAYGAAGALGGSLQSILWFNWNLMSTYGEPGHPYAEMWIGDPELDYMALGQSVYPVQLAGCNAPVLVAERKSEIGQYRLRNILLPESKRSLVMATVDPDFTFGEVLAADGYLHSALSMMVCEDE